MRILRPATIGFLSLALAGAFVTAYLGIGSRFTAQTGGGGSCTTPDVLVHTSGGNLFTEHVAVDSFGNLWSTVQNRGSGIGRLTKMILKNGEYVPAQGFPLASRTVPYALVAGGNGDVWFAEEHVDLHRHKIGRIDASGTMTEYDVANAVQSMTPGPDGNLWFTLTSGSNVSRMTPSGAITTFAVPSGDRIWDIVAGPGGHLWFVSGSNVGRMTVNGAVTLFQTDNSRPNEIIVGPDGNLWFARDSTNGLGRMTPGGSVTEYPDASSAHGIAAGPDGNVWFIGGDGGGWFLGRMSPGGGITEYRDFPDTGYSYSRQEPTVLGAGPDGNLWFGMRTETTQSFLGRITPSGDMTLVGSGWSEGGNPLPLEPNEFTIGADGNLWFANVVYGLGEVRLRGCGSSGGGSSSSASSCPARCGDYIIMAPEECDNAGANSDTQPNACRRNCTKAHCGDRVIDSGEECDDGNAKNGDGCAANCSIEPSSSSSSSSSAKSSSSASSKSSSKSSSSSSKMSSSSSSALCGNGRRDGAEKCDDGNAKDGDGCSKKCEVEDGWECRLSGGSSSSKKSGSSSKKSASASSSESSGKSSSQSADCPAGALCIYGGDRIGACPGGADAVPMQPYRLCGGGEASRGCYTCPTDSGGSACTDSDGGLNVFAVGTIDLGPVAMIDACDKDSRYILEVFCTGASSPPATRAVFVCPNGGICSDGKCSGGGGWNGDRTCFDTDAGSSTAEKGIATLWNLAGTRLQLVTESCVDDDTVREAVCAADGSALTIVNLNCPQGQRCDDGRCL